MPKFETTDKFFFSFLGSKKSTDELEKIFPAAKAEIDSYDKKTGELKIELNDTNRPDLWSAMGLARTLKIYENEKIINYNFFKSTNKELKKLIIDNQYPKNRPFSLCFMANGKKVTEDILKALIQLQEKICDNFGRKRKSIAIGIYRSKLINFPIHYREADPDKTSFIPLHENEKMTLREVLTKVQKGIEYGDIIKDWKKYPLLVDDKNEVLSMPPIINSSLSGSVEVEDSDLLIEMSGPNLEQLMLALNIIACDIADIGFNVIPMKVELPFETEYGKTIVVPNIFQTPTTCSLKKAEKLLGEKYSTTDIKKFLLKMGTTCTIKNDTIVATPAPWRNDYLCDVDIIEDIAIGKGLENIKSGRVEDFTVGRLSKVEELSRKIKEILIGLGYQEMIYNYLSSKKEFVDNMLFDEKKCIFISNPMSENYSVVRPSVLPSLLKTENNSQSAPFPHKIFEIGKTAIQFKGGRDGLLTSTSLGFLESGKGSNYNKISSLISALFYYLNLEYKLEKSNEKQFITGRQASINVKGENVGIFGEASLEVLNNWQVFTPAVMAEINIDKLTEILNK